MKKHRIYLDNCCYNRPYDDQSQLKINLEALAKLEIQQRIRDGKVELVSSYILLAENAANRFEIKRRDIKAFIDQYTCVFVSEASEKRVKSLATEIMKTGIKLMDACHISCALLADSEYFISTDRRLLKYQSDRIKIMNPVTYVVETEEIL